ncbi:protein-L-isoaspartate O-methyltransferase [Chelatococcus sp. SYSU_G07232]|uniref:Protein-L-isoaspartate O-methyltransferase n=1 Tax=Chelatococcus albus TaxID=3047466 RepID=A0ABT7ACN1_9HYPH|nr:protein-L-isoaspartate O-methyltransferase [Chelatococcus sp. SYSU_G07232]MDJ1157128.1 protein-L-isoaspartate O-methyltransferase [Chelatococcus sp. SYSU_G07232]
MRASSDSPAAAPPNDGAGPATGAEETVAFLLNLRERGIRDTSVLRAMETVPRDLFAPRRFADLARADVSLPLPCGQTMTAPATIATMLVALGVEAHHRVLEVGTGSGYVSAVLGRLGREVVSVERFRTLALAASERVAALGLRQVRIMPGDGFAVGAMSGLFDRILLNGTITGLPKGVLAALPPGGRMVAARIIGDQPRLVSIERTAEGELVEHQKGIIRLPPLVEGTARAL